MRLIIDVNERDLRDAFEMRNSEADGLSHRRVLAMDRIEDAIRNAYALQVIKGGETDDA